MKRLPGVIALSVTAVLVATATPARAEQQLPNLVPLPPQHVRVAEADPVEDPDAPQPERALRFTTTTFNHSDYPLDLTFVPSSVDDVVAKGRDILQCVALAGPVCIERQPAGRAFYHKAHNHWHMEDYARYALVPVTPEGMPDFDAEPVAPGVKASFCIIDTDTAEGARTTDVPTYRGCDDLRQGMSAHHGDTYGSGLYGQQIVIDDVPPGVYGLVITVNPVSRLLESSYDDNRSWAVLEFGPAECHHDEVTVLATGVS